MKAILIRGDFTKEDFLELMAALRIIDARRQEAHFEIVAIDPTGSPDEAEAIMRDTIPAMSGRWARFKR